MSATAAGEAVIYVRFKDPETVAALYRWMAQADQPMREVVELACKFAFRSQEFYVPNRAPAYMERAEIAKKRRIAQAKKKAGG